MNVKDRDSEYNCYFELVLDIVGGNWKQIILYYLGLEKVMRYGELKKAIPRITDRMLSKQLKEMEADKIIKRKVYKQIPPKVEYSLEQIGKDVFPILEDLKEWGKKYNRINNKSKFLLNNLK